MFVAKIEHVFVNVESIKDGFNRISISDDATCTTAAAATDCAGLSNFACTDGKCKCAAGYKAGTDSPKACMASKFTYCIPLLKHYYDYYLRRRSFILFLHFLDPFLFSSRFLWNHGNKISFT